MFGLCISMFGPQVAQEPEARTAQHNGNPGVSCAEGQHNTFLNRFCEGCGMEISQGSADRHCSNCGTTLRD